MKINKLKAPYEANNGIKNDFKIELSSKKVKGSYNSIVNRRSVNSPENAKKKQKSKITFDLKENQDKINSNSPVNDNKNIGNTGSNKFLNNNREETYIETDKANRTGISLNKISNEFQIQNKEGRRTDYNSNSMNKNLLNKNNNLIQNQNDYASKNVKTTSKAKNNNILNNITKINSNTNELSSNPMKINKLKAPYESNNGIKTHYHYNTKIKSINDFSKNPPDKKIATPNRVDLSSNNNSNNNLRNNIYLKSGKSKKEMNTKSTRYNFVGINSFRNNIHKKKLISRENNYTVNRKNNLSYNHPNLSNRSNYIRGGSSPRKKNFSYHHIMSERVSSNHNNAPSFNTSIQSKLKKMPSKKLLSHSKEKDIQFFLYKNKTNIAQNNLSINLNVYNPKNNVNKNKIKNNIIKQRVVKSNNSNIINTNLTSSNTGNNLNNKNLGNTAIVNTDV